MTQQMESLRLPEGSRKEGQSDQPGLFGQSQTLVSFNEIPEWYSDNKYILHGYRPISNSARACFNSWKYLHNETVNIYSHLIPGLFFLAGEWYLLQYLQAKYPQATLSDFVVFAFFLLTTTICFGMSAMYHTLMNHSVDVSNLWLQVDLIGIVISTLGNFVSGIYVIFYCEPELKRRYWAMIFTLSVVSITLLMSPKFQGNHWRGFRVGTFITTALTGFAPIFHGVFLYGFERSMAQSGMPYYFGEGSLLLLGAVFYMTRIPECMKPGTFDIFGASHQIFHTLVVLATTIHFLGILSAFDYNYRHRTCTL